MANLDTILVFEQMPISVDTILYLRNAIRTTVRSIVSTKFGVISDLNN
jgi:hypothetical protein